MGHAENPHMIRHRSVRRFSWLSTPVNWLRAGLVLVVVATAAIAAAPAASAATRLGGIDLQRYCTDTAPVGWVSKIVLVENHARGWRCQDSTYYGAPIGWISVLRSLDLNQACRMQYGQGAYAVLEQNHAQGWKCYR